MIGDSREAATWFLLKPNDFCATECYYGGKQHRFREFNPFSYSTSIFLNEKLFQLIFFRKLITFVQQSSTANSVTQLLKFETVFELNLYSRIYFLPKKHFLSPQFSSSVTTHRRSRSVPRPAIWLLQFISRRIGNARVKCLHRNVCPPLR